MTSPLQTEKVWLDKHRYHDAERAYHESLAKETLTPLAAEVAKARKRLIEIKDTFPQQPFETPFVTTAAFKSLESKISELQKTLSQYYTEFRDVEQRLSKLEKYCLTTAAGQPHPVTCPPNAPVKVDENDDDEVDLFGSDSEEEDETAAKIREARLAEYNAKKSKKPALIAKSNIILDVKPWDDETDMAEMEKAVRNIATDGLLWGAAKLVPLAYGIHKLQISCVVEDDKVSIDWLQEQIEAIEDYVQSVDIAAFNKV